MLGLSFILLCSFQTIVFPRLDIDSEACQVYLKKFDSVDGLSGTGLSQLSFTGDASIIKQTNDVQINLKYFDPLYNNSQYFGLVQEDGKFANETCLDLKLWKYKQNFYNDPIQVTDLRITGHNDSNKRQRYLSFIINEVEFGTRLDYTYNNAQKIYIGYYSISYDSAATTKTYFSFYYQFFITVSKSTGQILETAFKPLNYLEQQCSILACSSVVDRLIWCTDPTCETNKVPGLSFKDQFYLKSQVTTIGLMNYYLTNTTVYYVGEGLNKVTKPISINNSIPGQVTLLLTADLVWSNVGIQVISYLSTTLNGESYDPITGVSEKMTCIKFQQDSSTCATCAEQCEVNDGIAGGSCPVCYSSLFEIVIILLIFLF